MTRYIAPFLAAWLVACSSEKPPESAYEASASTTTSNYTDTNITPIENDPTLVPASGVDTTRSEADRTTPVDHSAPAEPSAPTERSATPGATEKTSDKTATERSSGSAPDNTKVNERDRAASAVTPMDQGENSADLSTTQRIRQALMGDGSLSFTAKNVKVITRNGKVTLRGPVNSAAERTTVETAARKIAGATNVDSQLEVAK